jgi:CTP:molybdopterin cytidylyltransferase MocA
VASLSSEPVEQAIILAAGNGERFKSPVAESKLVRPVLGIPLIIRTLDSVACAGIRRVEMVLGYQADQVRRLVLREKPANLSVRFHVNDRWREGTAFPCLPLGNPSQAAASRC